jgi:hypothetical protein
MKETREERGNYGGRRDIRKTRTKKHKLSSQKSENSARDKCNYESTLSKRALIVGCGGDKKANERTNERQPGARCMCK